MPDLVEDLSQRARALSPEDRAQPAEKLLESLHEDTDPDIEAAWDAEIRRRVAEVESGAVKLVPAEEVFDEIRYLALGLCDIDRNHTHRRCRQLAKPDMGASADIRASAEE